MNVSQQGTSAVRAREALRAEAQTPERAKISWGYLLKSCTLIGAAGFLLLNLIEQIDLNLRLNSVFASVSGRVVLLIFSSVGILFGALAGFVTGLSIILYSTISVGIKRALIRLKVPRALAYLAALLFTAGLAAILLNQLQRINLFIIGMIREFEKLRVLRDTLLNHERSTSYLMLMGIVTICALTVIIVRASKEMNRYVRALWVAALVAAIVFVYRTDSRVEVQLYEFTMHRSLYLISVFLALALAGTLILSSSFSPSSAKRLERKHRWSVVAALSIVFIASLGFTFFRFGKDQSLKSIIFSRSTQAKQNMLLAWWALDRDGDGYASWLDGGDTSDSNALISPNITEAVGDGIDNNGLAGDLSVADLNDWLNQHKALGLASSIGSRAFNVIFFFVDTVRADHLSTYGYHRKTTPNLDRLAERSVVFDNAFSPAARTAEAIPRFMQSSYWDAGIESWTQVLARQNYKVSLFPGRRSWERYARMMHPVKGAQGKALEENIDFIIEKLGASSGEPELFCAYVYVPDPHMPYIQHREFDFGASIVDLYDGELAYTDFQIGRLIDWLDRSGRFKDTMIVVMSDHGESLGERDTYRHASQLYNEQTHVPMIIYHPEVQPRRVRDYVSTIDLGATILGANGISSPEGYIGVNLFPLMKGQSIDRPPVYAELTKEEVSQYVRLDQQIHPEWKKYMAIAPDGWKIIFNRDVFTFELYDLAADPREQRNLFSAMPEKAEEMKRLVLRYVDIVTASRPPGADEGRYSKAGGADGDKVEN